MKEKKKTEKNSQLGLGLKSPIRNYFFRLKGRVQQAFIYLEVVNFVKDPLNWLFIVLPISLILTQGYFLFETYDSLPSVIPIYSYFTNLHKKIAPQRFSLLLPAISFLLLLISVRVSYRFFHKERIMSAILLLCSLLSIILITLQVLRITMPFYG